MLAFFTTGGEIDHYLFARDAMRPLGANAAAQGYSFAATSDWDVLPGRVNVDDPGHPTVKNLPASFVAPIDEWYSWAPSPRLNRDIKVLLTLNESNFPMGVKNMLNGGDIPVAWTNTRYRTLYLNYGHGDRIYTSPILTAMIDNSLAWLLGVKP